MVTLALAIFFVLAAAFGGVGLGILVGRHYPSKESRHALTTEPQWRYGSPEPEPEPICGCAHSYAFHDGKGCHHPDSAYVERFGPFQRVATCTCRHYVGPEPLPRVIS